MILRSRLALAAVLALIAGAACGNSPPSRAEVVESLVDTELVPAYQDLAGAADSFEEAVEALCATPGEESLEAARAALGELRTAWKTTSAFWIGPVMQRRSWARVDWPVDPEAVEDLVADQTLALDADSLATTIGADQRGLAAAEYLLYPSADRSDADVLAALDDARRCDYLVSLAAVVSIEATAVLESWTDGADGDPPYREVALEDTDETIDALVNESVFLLDALSQMELGRALGSTTPEADLSAIEEGPGGLGVQDAVDRLGSVRIVFEGSDGSAGLGELLSDELAERLGSQLDDAVERTAAVPAPLRDAAAGRDPAVLETAEAIETLRVLAETEIVSALGVTIGFSDADGDSAG